MTIIVKDGVFRTPSGFKVKAHSYASLEADANTLRPSLPTVSKEVFMLDCLSIFEGIFPQKLGYAYRTVSIDDVDECAAFTMTLPDGNVVVLREDIYDKLHAGNPFGRSTVVHELSHIALEHPITLHRGASVGGHKFYEDSEWQAKALTGALMMPLEACKIAKSPKDLADMCGTSVEAARYRINTLVNKLKLLAPNHSLWEYAEK
jgi:IrrE N-terminal-like domain